MPYRLPPSTPGRPSRGSWPSPAAPRRRGGGAAGIVLALVFQTILGALSRAAWSFAAWGRRVARRENPGHDDDGPGRPVRPPRAGVRRRRRRSRIGEAVAPAARGRAPRCAASASTRSARRRRWSASWRPAARPPAPTSMSATAPSWTRALRARRPPRPPRRRGRHPRRQRPQAPPRLRRRRVRPRGRPEPQGQLPRHPRRRPRHARPPPRQHHPVLLYLRPRWSSQASRSTPSPRPASCNWCRQRRWNSARSAFPSTPSPPVSSRRRSPTYPQRSGVARRLRRQERARPLRRGGADGRPDSVPRLGRRELRDWLPAVRRRGWTAADDRFPAVGDGGGAHGAAGKK